MLFIIANVEKDGVICSVTTLIPISIVMFYTPHVGAEKTNDNLKSACHSRKPLLLKSPECMWGRFGFGW